MTRCQIIINSNQFKERKKKKRRAHPVCSAMLSNTKTSQKNGKLRNLNARAKVVKAQKKGKCRNVRVKSGNCRNASANKYDKQF